MAIITTLFQNRFFCHSSASLYYTEHKPKNKKQGRPVNEANSSYSFNCCSINEMLQHHNQVALIINEFTSSCEKVGLPGACLEIKSVPIWFWHYYAASQRLFICPGTQTKTNPMHNSKHQNQVSQLKIWLYQLQSVPAWSLQSLQTPCFSICC